MKVMHLTGKDDEKWVRTTVEDHGTGIPPDVMKRIFDPFFTTKERGKGTGAAATGPTGTGLGLSVSYGIISDHHGELWVESEEGEYTRFQMDLRADLRVDKGWGLGEDGEETVTPDVRNGDREEMKVTDEVGEKKGEEMKVTDEVGEKKGEEMKVTDEVGEKKGDEMMIPDEGGG